MSIEIANNVIYKVLFVAIVTIYEIIQVIFVENICKWIFIRQFLLITI